MISFLTTIDDGDGDWMGGGGMDLLTMVVMLLIFRRRGTHRMGVPHDCASRCEPRVVCNNERLCWRPLLGAETALRGLCFVSHASSSLKVSRAAA